MEDNLVRREAMTITEIGTEYSSYTNACQKTKTAQAQNTFHPVTSPSEETDKKKDSKVLGIAMVKEEGSNKFYGMRAQYAEGSTAENPVIQVTSNMGGQTVSYQVNINEVDPENASQLEMFALCNYADDQGIGEKSTFGSYQTLKCYQVNASDIAYSSIGDTLNDYVNSRQNWITMVDGMRKVYYDAGSLKQYMDGLSLLSIMKS